MGTDDELCSAIKALRKHDGRRFYELVEGENIRARHEPLATTDARAPMP